MILTSSIWGSISDVFTHVYQVELKYFMCETNLYTAQTKVVFLECFLTAEPFLFQRK
jgi:hypothetical protein